MEMKRMLFQTVRSNLLTGRFSYVSARLCQQRFNITILQVFQNQCLPFAHVLLIERRYYRVKADSLSQLPLEQQFISRLLAKIGIQTLTDRELRTYTERFHHIVQTGFRGYELAECPAILLLGIADINARVKKLSSAKYIDKISLGMLMYSLPYKSDNEVRDEILTYLNPLGGYMNKTDEIFEALNCSDTKMLEIIIRNPRLIGAKYRVEVAAKIRCLIQNGSLYEDLYRNTNVLNNQTLATIESRMQRLANIDWKPLPVALIGRDDRAFDSVVSHLEEERKHVTERNICKATEVIDQLPPVSTDRILLIRPRIEYLLSEGYSVTDIVLCSQVLDKSLSRLKSTVSELKPYHLERVNLSNVCQYAMYRYLPFSRRVPQFRAVFAGAIGCPISDIPPLPKDCSISPRGSKTLAYGVGANVCYLRDQLGFTAEDLASVPLVLAHSPHVVHRHWNALNDVDAATAGCKLTNTLFHRHGDNRRLQLNLLQYSIEKEVNFSHSFVVHGANESDDELGAAEPELSSETSVDDEARSDVEHHHHSVIDGADNNDDDDDDLRLGSDSDAEYK